MITARRVFIRFLLSRTPVVRRSVEAVKTTASFPALLLWERHHEPAPCGARVSAMRASTREKSLPTYFRPPTTKAGYRRKPRSNDLKNPSTEAASTSLTVTRDPNRAGSPPAHRESE